MLCFSYYAMSSLQETKLAIRAEQVLPGSEGGETVGKGSKDEK
jgi:hypothetical protein